MTTTYVALCTEPPADKAPVSDVTGYARVPEVKSWTDIYKESKEKKIEPRALIKLMEAEGWVALVNEAGMERKVKK